MKFLWYIAAHERIEVTSMCYRGLHRVNEYARKQGHEVDVFIVCSDRIHQELAAAHGFYFSNIIPNQPLGRKMNLGLVEAMELDFDYIVQSGTDNLYTSNLLTFYADKIKQTGFEFFGLNKIYFYDFYRHIAKLYSPLSVFGAGRAISRNILEEASRKVNIWPDHINKGLDNSSERIIEMNFENIVFSHPVFPNVTPSVVDIKSEVNIHKYADMFGKVLNETQIEELRFNFRELWKQ